ncbi:MAG: ATP-dependent DNA ligase [Acidimicrobiales bacterium]|nr:ATP-dependent DNA ligase [Acidimicrobiales bacterium]
MDSTSTLLSELVKASQATAATSARNEKVAALAGFLAGVDPSEVPTAVALLTGVPRQGRVGIGWALVETSIANVDRNDHAAPAGPPLTLADIDTAVDTVSRTGGSGSDAAKRDIMAGLFQRATAEEADFLSDILVGGLRQGALAGVLASAISKAFGVKLSLLRRAAMLLGDLGEAGTIASVAGDAGLAGVGLTVGRAVEPMLAATSPDVPTALIETGTAAVEWKLDGIRIQVHKLGGEVWVFSRNLNDITLRVTGVIDVVRSLPVSSAILDGEVLGSSPHFFDIIHRDGQDLLNQPLHERMAHLEAVAGAHRIPSVITDDPEQALAQLAAALAAGHEGAMVKGIDTRYEAGRRGKGWRKVKPVHTLDLVVLGAEWGHGRRKGWLSNLHLGARNNKTGEYVMVGKTFKGLTDHLLEWQTEQLLMRETHREGITVFARPELVVEIAVDSTHASTRYPGGVALRFARVRRYRDDKSPTEADTVETVRSLMVTLPAHELPE